MVVEAAVTPGTATAETATAEFLRSYVDLEF